MRSSLIVPSASALALVAAISLSGCGLVGSGPAVTQEREILDVEAVQLDTSGDLTVILGETPSLTVTAGNRIIDRLTNNVNDGVLRLGLDGDAMPLDGEIRYELTVSSLESLTVLGSGNASVDLSAAEGPTITLRGSGSVDASGVEASKAALTVVGSGVIAVEDAAIENLEVRLDGSGGVALSGVATSQHVELEGSGAYSAPDLHSVNAFVTVRGSGEAIVTADTTLEARVDGSGGIFYEGDARVTEEVVGSGEISRR